MSENLFQIPIVDIPNVAPLTHHMFLDSSYFLSIVIFLNSPLFYDLNSFKIYRNKTLISGKSKYLLFRCRFWDWNSFSLIVSKWEKNQITFNPGFFYFILVNFSLLLWLYIDGLLKVHFKRNNTRYQRVNSEIFLW